MSLIFTAACVAGGIYLGRWMRRRLSDRSPISDPSRELSRSRTLDPHAPSRSLAEGEDSAPRLSTGRAIPHDDAEESTRLPETVRAIDWRAFPCALGDVVTHGIEERWLAGAIVLHEASPAAAIFVAPEAGGDRALLAWPRPTTELLWLEPVDAKEIAIAGEPPTVVELRGVRYERRRRWPLRASRMGTGTPDVGTSVLLADYEASGRERLVVLSGSGPVHAWRGSALDEGDYDVMPSGASTL